MSRRWMSKSWWHSGTPTKVALLWPGTRMFSFGIVMVSTSETLLSVGYCECGGDRRCQEPEKCTDRAPKQ
jgi:hypothetical protein